jgi:4-amino-4-deoxy-L-arabinose transferase-like glycosyltransferase
MTRGSLSFGKWYSEIAANPVGVTLLLAVAVLVPRISWFTILGGRLPLPVQDQALYVRSAVAVSQGRGLSFSREMALARRGRASNSPLADEWVLNPDYAFGLAPVDQPTAVMEPGYSLLLGLVFRVFGPVAGGVWVLNLAFSLIGAFAMLRLMEKFGEKEALSAALLWALYPPLVFYSAHAMTETAHAAMLVVCTALLFHNRSSVRGAFAAGLCIGAFFLIRATGVILLPLAILYVGIRKWRLWLALSLGFALAVSPWVIRNSISVGSPVLMPTKGSLNLWMRNHPGALAEEGIIVPASIPVNSPELLAYPSYEEYPGEVERSRELGRSAMEFMKANPRLMLWLSAQRALHFLSPGGSTLGRRAFWAGLALMVPLMVLGGAGLAREFRKPETRFLVAVFAAYLLMHTVAHGGTRYRIPSDMVFMAGAAMLLHRRRKQS